MNPETPDQPVVITPPTISQAPEAAVVTPPVETFTPPVPNQESPKSNKKLFIMGGVVLALLVLAAVGVFAFTQMQKPKEIVTEVTPSPTSEATIDETANWETYNDDSFNFSLGYPPGWTLVTQPHKDNTYGMIDLGSNDISSDGVTNQLSYRFNIFAKEGSFDETVIKYAIRCDTKASCDAKNKIQSLDYPQIEVGGHKAYKPGKGDEVYVDGDNYIIIIVGIWDKLFDDSESGYGKAYQYTGDKLSQILSTFEFINEILTTDKTAYKLGETVEITITNTTDAPMGFSDGQAFCSPLTIINIDTNKEFDKSTCISGKPDELITLDVGKSLTYTFNTNGLGTGNFEVRFGFSWTNRGAPVQTAKSTFSITS